MLTILSPVPFGAAKSDERSSYHCSDTASQTAIRVGAGTAQIRRVFGEILNINSHGGSGELPISAMALLAVVERGLYCSQSAQNLARRAAAP